MDLRIEFMNRVLRGERVTDLCREYGISRKTGEKFKARFKKLGEAGLVDQSRAPKVIPHKTTPEVEALIVAARKQHPTWGPKKLKELLEREHGAVMPSRAAVGAVLARHKLTAPRRKKPNYEPPPSSLVQPTQPNDVWCIDYKGQFRLGDRSYCYPLTITDQFSRYLLACEGMAAISDEQARDVCEEVFSVHGVPAVMRSDNGTPFSSTGLAGLTKLSAYWLRLGIRLDRIRPAHPEENGRHERMHRTLKAETTRPARSNLLQQQERFDEFLDEFNNVRPHEALNMKCPVEIHTQSPRRLPATLPELSYPMHDDVRRVNRHGQLSIPGFGQVSLSQALAGQDVGIREELDGRILVTFVNIDLGYYRRDKRFEPLTSVPPEAT